MNKRKLVIKKNPIVSEIVSPEEIYRKLLGELFENLLALSKNMENKDEFNN
jgi:hypothetical protein